VSPAERGSFCPDGPGVRFRPGRAEELGVSDNSLGGVLAWYSLIHTGPMLETFDHAVTTAWYWPVDMLRGKVEAAGFAVTHVESRSEPGSRAHGAITAVLS
jgi:hypothetical protein